MGPAEYLKMPYGRFVVPDSDGTFRAEIIEFPGCIAVGDTAAEALANLEDVAASWLEAVLAKGQRVPEPIEDGGFSGKLVVRLPKSLHKRAAYAAQREGVSLNHFIVSSIAEQVGSQSQFRHLSGQYVEAQVSSFTVTIPQPQTQRFTGFFGTMQILASTYSSNQVTDLPIKLVEGANAGS